MTSRPTLHVSGRVASPVVLDLEAVHGFDGVRDDHGLPGAGRAVPVSALLAVVRPAPDASFVTFESGDGHYRASVPIDVAGAKGWLLIGDDGRGLDRSRGGPARLLVQDGDTQCWNVKDVVSLRITVEQEPDSVPENPPH